MTCYQLTLIRVDTVWGPSAKTKHSPAHPPLNCHGTGSHIQRLGAHTQLAPHPPAAVTKVMAAKDQAAAGEELWSEVHTYCMASRLVACSTPCVS